MGNYLWILVILIVLWIRKKRRTAAVMRQILNRRKQNRETLVMKELAKQFIGEECIIYTVTSNDGSVQGVIKEIDDGGIVIERNSGEREIVNLDFVTRIRQYPRKKNGKKKASYWTKYRSGVIKFQFSGQLQNPLGTKGRTSILSYREYRASCGASFSVSRKKRMTGNVCVTSFRQGGYTPLRR